MPTFVTWPRTWRGLAAALGAVLLIAFWAWAMLINPNPGGKPFGVDARAFWAADSSAPYVGPEAGLAGAYLYSPVFLQILTPLRLLPWEAFIGLWIAAELFTLAWLLTPLGAVVALVLPPVASEVLIGNVHVFLAAALVLSVQRPSAWILALITKPTLGVLLFYHRWRAWLQVTALMLLVAVISAVLAPSWWAGWFGTLGRAGDRGGMWWGLALFARLAVAAGIAWYAGSRHRPAWLAPAAYLALPIPWLEGLTLLAAVPRLARLKSR